MSQIPFDRATISRLHNEVKLQSVEQRGIFQLLKLMYSYSKDVNHLKVPQRHTRAGAKVKFDIPSRFTEKYLNSPLYKGSQIWDPFPEYGQCPETLGQFIKHVYYQYANYRNLIDT